MSLFKILSIFFLLNILSGELPADPLTEDQKKQVEGQLKFELEFRNFALKMSRTINENIGDRGLFSLTKTESDTLLEKHILEFSNFYKEHYKIPSGKMLALKERLKNLNFEAIKNAMKTSIIKSDVFIKQYGLGKSMAIFLGYLTDVVIITLSGSLGLSKYLLSVPFGPIYASIFNIVVQLELRFKMLKTLGGKKNYDTYMKEKNHIAKKLGLGDPYRWILPDNRVLISAGDQMAISIPRYLFLPSFIHKLGIANKDLNYSNLLNWIKENNVKSDFIAHIKDSASLEQWQKAGNLVWHIMNQQPQEVRDSFVLKFGHQFKKIKQLDNYKALKRWTLKMMSAENLDEVEDLLFQKVPKNTPAVVILGLWNNFILPHYAYRKEFSQKDYRKTAYESKIMLANTDYESSLWSKDHSQKIFNLLNENFKNKSFSQCHPMPEEILSSLIKQSR